MAANGDVRTMNALLLPLPLKHARRRMLGPLLAVLLGLVPYVMYTAPAQASAPAAGDFVREAFAGAMPRPQAVFLTDALRARVERVLGHRTTLLRVRYWRQGERTVWVLDEIGKEQPITTGIQVDGRTISRVKVLQYRESRGGEVQRASFTSQFANARLVAGDALDRNIDGITGATMSVRALTRQARMALVLHDVVASTPSANVPAANTAPADTLRAAR
jgi:hypothetical protein